MIKSNQPKLQKEKIHQLKPDLETIISKQLAFQKDFQKYNFQQLADNTTHQKDKLQLLTFAYLKKGKGVSEIAEALNISRTVICNWVKKFNQDELEKLVEKIKSRPESKTSKSK
jgi:predicted DNA-binding protein YlxM (UPF0122 family)